MKSTFLAVLVSTLAATILPACASGPNRIAKNTIRASGVVASDYKTSFSGFGSTADLDHDYQSIEVGIGVTYFERVPDADDAQGPKRTRFEFLVGRARFDELDAIEIAGGGRYFLGRGPRLQPFFSLYLVSLAREDFSYFGGGSQLGVRPGGGIEYALSDSFFLDAVLDYMAPISAAETGSSFFGSETIDTKVSGWALRLGIGFNF